MKRFLVFISFIFIVWFSFAEEAFIPRFTWDSKYEEIMSYYIHNGWSMRLEDDFVHFDAPRKKDYYYINKTLKVSGVFYSFDSDGKPTSQNICCDDEYSILAAYVAMMSVAVNDNSTFYDQDFKNADNGIHNINYYAHTDSDNINYAIVGRDDICMVFICYKKITDND